MHPQHPDVWYWTIPFSDGRCSQGVVAEKAFLDRYTGTETERLRALVAEEPGLAKLLGQAQWDTPARQIAGYSANVKSLWGNGYALLGNAGEFLDPVFSSGVTIAFKSASLAAQCLVRQLAGDTVDWEKDFAQPLRPAWTASAFCRSLVRRPLPAADLPSQCQLRNPRHDLVDPGRLRVGPQQPLRGRAAPPAGGAGRILPRMMRRICTRSAFAPAPAADFFQGHQV